MATIIGAGSCVIEGLIRGVRSAVGDRAEVCMSQDSGDGRPRIDPGIATRCAVLIEEASPWNGYAALAADERAALAPGHAVIKVPTAHFNSLWPLLFNDPRNLPEPHFPWGRYPFARSDRLAAQIRSKMPGAALEEWLEAYHRAPVGSLVDIDRNHEFECANLFQREEGCDLKVAAYIVSQFRERRLFYTHHHPTPDLLAFMMVQVLGHAALAPFLRNPVDTLLRDYRATIDAQDPFGGDEMPIHPEVAAHFQLDWWRPDATYMAFGSRLTFNQWLAGYMRYEPPPIVAKRAP